MVLAPRVSQAVAPRHREASLAAAAATAAPAVERGPDQWAHEEERKKMFDDTDAEIEHIRHLRILEEEKLKLLKLA